MINSRDISLLRDDVERNVRSLVRRCDAEGLHILITQTVRDNAYQAALYAQGRTKPGNIVTNSRTTTFHGAGLAIDFCKNSRTDAYSDSVFFDRVIAIAKEIGFSSGRDWKSFKESCHLQWDNHGKATHKNAPIMPTWEDDEMTGEEIYKALNEYCDKKTVPDGVMDEWKECIDMGLTDGSNPCRLVPAWRAFIVAKRAMQRK